MNLSKKKVTLKTVRISFWIFNILTFIGEYENEEEDTLENLREEVSDDEVPTTKGKRKLSSIMKPRKRINIEYEEVETGQQEEETV
jgi:hypothetical protein